jgi:hypothetical protein
VDEVNYPGWTQTFPSTGNHIVYVGLGQTISGVDFGNVMEGRISGYTWYDSDHDGVWDADENAIAGKLIQLWLNGILIGEVFSDVNGYYCFYDLGPGTYMVKEVLPLPPGGNLVWAITSPDSGQHTIMLTIGMHSENNSFGNVVEYTGGLSWGYWKTHTGYDSPPRDEAYDLLPAKPMSVDVMTPDGDYEVDNDYEAKWFFKGAGGDKPPNARGDGVGLFRCQLLALHMNLLKFDGMANTTFYYDGDPYDGWTVQQIYDFALDKLVNPPTGYDYHELLNTIDIINNNGHYNTGSYVLVPLGSFTPVY